MEPYIYLRVLKHAEHTVFCVEEGQKTYRDPLFNGKIVAYSSGQQVKRSILQTLVDSFGEQLAPVTFNYNINRNQALENKEPWSPCDPNYVDQLLGGWMRAGDGITKKRRSPLSISAMRPLHPSFCELDSESTDFDRKGLPAEYNASEEKIGIHNVRVYEVKDNKQVELSQEQLQNWLNKNERALPAHYYNPSQQKRATGLFVYDVAIDLRTLFCVSTNQFEPELSTELIQKMKSEGWIVSKNVFGECLVMPEDKRKEVIPALANALINWRITSNQARTFSLMETFAIALSHNANIIADAIRTERDNNSGTTVYPVIDKDVCNDVFVTLASSGYISSELSEKAALQKAEAKLIEMLSKFNYEHQL